MFECVSGLSSAPDIAGCILADDMGYAHTVWIFFSLYLIFSANPYLWTVYS